MSLRFYSPRIRAALTMSQDLKSKCDGASLIFESQTYCSLEKININGQSESPIISSDIPLINSNADTFLILAGNPENSNFGALIEQGTDFAKNENIGFAVRWKLASDYTDKTPLTGYGVELRLKSTEYKAQDDSGENQDDGDH